MMYHKCIPAPYTRLWTIVSQINAIRQDQTLKVIIAIVSKRRELKQVVILS